MLVSSSEGVIEPDEDEPEEADDDDDADDADEPAASPASFGAVSQAASKPIAAIKMRKRLVMDLNSHILAG